ncbi:MAG: competence/damage-inducible protein A [wastewater metagenome]|nr:competence/damage-inducible protein A [Candidatus Loosdrechtia aerotolerans]
MTRAEIITIGTEIIVGHIVNTNVQYIAKALAERGFQVQFQTSVCDNKEELKAVLQVAIGRADLIITTGGLGLTENDVTRDAVSEFFGVSLIHNKDACVRIQKLMDEQYGNLTEGHNKQTLVPEGSLVIANDNGTATGFAFRSNDKEIVCLPGVPREMQFMLHKYLGICSLRDTRKEGCTLSRNIHTFGIPERTVEDTVKKCVFHDRGQIKTMTLVHNGIVTIHLHAIAATREDAVKLLDMAETDIRKEFGHAIFGVGDETLEYTVATLLKKYRKTIAVAESCTGGLVADKLTNIPGISEFFMEGIVAYSNRVKIDRLGVPEDLIIKHGAVSPQVARAMAEGIRKKASTDIGIGITGIAGPTGGTKEKPVGLVYITVAVDDSIEVKECRFRGSRIDIKKFSANTALNMVRILLLDCCL